MPATDDAGGLTEEEIDKACARAVISAKVAHAEARGYKIAAESFFEKCIEFKREIDAAFDVVCEQAREIARLRTRLAAAERLIVGKYTSYSAFRQSDDKVDDWETCAKAYLALRTGGAGVPSEKYYACYDYGSCNDGSHSSNVVECETDAEPTTDATEFCRRVIQRGGPHTDEYDIKRFAAELRAMLDAAVRAEREKNAARLGQAERVAQAAREVADDEAKCRYDHNDFCQAHYSSRPCREEVLRDALAAWEAGK